MRELFVTLLTDRNVPIGAGDMLRPETRHPRLAEVPVGWTCSECGEPELVSATICPDCYAVLCGKCAERDHHEIPAGLRAGQQCDGNRPCGPS